MIVTMPGEKILAADWERIFPRAKGRKRQQAIKAKSKTAEDVSRRAPLICDDRPWGSKGLYYPCLGETVYSRADEREKFKRAGIQHIG